MSTRFSATLLRRIRNDIPVDRLIQERLQMTCKLSEGIFRFLCPLCADFHTATNHRTNLARCFRCQRNFNPIDILMMVERVTFRDAVAILKPMLPAQEENGPRHEEHKLAGHGNSGGVKYPQMRRLNHSET